MKRPAAAMGAAVIGSAAAAYLLVVRPWQLRWGGDRRGTRRHPRRRRPHPQPDLVATRAITVHAAADQVWPWIAQLGQGRALVLRGGVPMGTVPPLRLHLGLCPAGAAGGDAPAAGPRALRLHPVVGAVAGRAGCGGRLRDEPMDAPRDQGSRRTDWPAAGLKRAAGIGPAR